MDTRRGKVVWLTIAFALSACGSTLQPTAAVDVDGGGQAVGGAPGPTSATVTSPGGAGAAATPVAGATGGGAGTNDAVGGTDLGSSGAGDAPGGSTGETAAGPTDPLVVGVLVVDPGALLSVFGAEAGDYLAADRAMIEYINANGGAAGRVIDARFVTIDVAANQNTEGQRACEEFVSQSVDIVFSRSGTNEVTLSCLEQQGLAVVDGSVWIPDRPYADLHPNWFVPFAMGVDRYARAAIDVAVEQGVLGAGDTLGVLYEDCAWGRRVYDNVILPLAQQHGFAAERATIKCIENLVADLGPVTNQSTAAALRFRSVNATHILTLTAAEGFVVGRTADAAVGQRYFPKYLITSNAFPSNNSNPDNTIHFPTEALAAMTGIGWIPHIDLGPGAQPSPDQATQQGACDAALASVPDPAYETEDDRVNGEMGQYSACDGYFVLRDIIAGSGGRTAIADVATGYQSVLANSRTAVFLTGRFGGATNRPDGMGVVQPLALDPATGRFTYTASPRPVP